MRAVGVIFVVDGVENIKDELKGKTILRERNKKEQTNKTQNRSWRKRDVLYQKTVALQNSCTLFFRVQPQIRE